MVEVESGVKAGLVSGIIYGLVNAIVNIAVMDIILPTVFPDSFVPVLGVDAINVVGVLLAVSLIAGLIMGLIFGVIFAVLYTELPGRTSVIKGAIFSILIWVIWIIFGLSTSVEWPPPEARSLISIPTMISLGTSILWGILLGYLWDRFSPKH